MMDYKKSQLPQQRRELYLDLIMSRRWRSLRNRKITDEPLCEVCKSEGRITLAQEVHHIFPIEQARTPKEAKERAFDYDNLMSVCRVCHKLLHNPSEQKPKRNAFLESLDITS